MSFLNLKKIFSSGDQGFLKSLEPMVVRINSFERQFSSLRKDDFSRKTEEFRERIKKGESLDELLPEAFALVREATKRTLGQRHYDVQLIGGIILHQGKITEMRTGEGKTLVATLPAYLNALKKEGVHIVTVNDYLSRRDANWMGQIYNYLGLSVGVINSQNISFIYDESKKEELDKKRDELGYFKIFEEYLKPCSRKEAYQADITYGTNNEFGFDYLRDNLVQKEEEISQGGYSFAIIDEIDSILIDEARTPLIISSPSGDSDDFYVKFSNIAKQLKINEDYTVDEKMKAISLTDSGISKTEKTLGIENIYTEKGIKYVHHLETAVRAQSLFQNNKDYLIKDGEIIIVDVFTGRLQPGRRWSEGLHQAIEAKEGVEIQKETRTVASITFQNYFKFYKKLSGMTGTAKTSTEEFFKVYGLEVISVPTNTPMIRIDQNDLIYQTEQGKFKAIAQKVKEINKKGQPVLIGTVSVEKNELLSAYLTREGVSHQVLNAKKHESEGGIIAQGGRKGSVVVATNMAGRGIDIQLGGKPSTKEQYEEVKKLGGLFVLGTERHEARRIDNQLRGRSGRQGDPGETQFFVSLEDELMRIFGSDRIKAMMGRFGIPEDQPIKNNLITRALENAQKKIEGFNFDSRRHILEYDDVLNKQRNTIYLRRKKMLTKQADEIKNLLGELSENNQSIQILIKKKKEIIGDDEFLEIIRRIILYVTDILWIEHLETMEYLRSSVNLRAYGQRDPLIEYKREGIRLFREMEEAFKDQVLSFIEKINNEAVQKKEEDNAKKIAQKFISQHESQGQFSQNQQKKEEPITIYSNELKVGRNDPCPCGSGKKYKKCGYLNTEEHRQLIIKK